MTPAEITPATGPPERLSRREENRRDRAVAAQIERDNAAARTRMAIERDRAWFEERRTARADRAALKAAARAARARRVTALLAGTRDHKQDLLFAPVIGIPGVLAWPSMAAYGSGIWGPLGVILPGFSEGAMWAFDVAVAIRRHQDPDKPVWHLQLGIAVFAAFGAALNFLHGMAPGTPHHGLAVAVSMALISVAGVTAHQLVIAGPRRPRAERARARLERVIARRKQAARKAAARHARVRLDEDGGAELVYQPGTARLKHRFGRPRLAGFQPLPAVITAPARTDEAAPADSVRDENRTDPGDVPAPGPVQDEPVRTEPARIRTDGPPAVRDEEHAEARTAGEAPAAGNGGGPDAAPLAELPRSAIVGRLADEIRDAIDAGTVWKPDYDTLMTSTGRRRSWCEKVVRDARNHVLDPGGQADGDDGSEPRTDDTGRRLRSVDADEGTPDTGDDPGEGPLADAS
jgi:hypothetical protein